MEDQTQQPQASPEVRARIQASFDRQGLMRHLGARIAHIASGCVRIVLPSRPEVTQQHGYVHAGASSAIADSAGGYAAFTLAPENTSVLTVEYKINLLAPAVGDHIEAVGTVLRSGRTLAVCQLQVFGVQDGHRSLVATGQQTLMFVKERAEQPENHRADI
ncbi:PaaI family thioesterase [Nonomuraea sp. NPDC049141]|uniref:PaaI family thioesterase n=1 Tax=unclassified Nonomuraea TaxID=2593643 RepID=UPI0033E745A2